MYPLEALNLDITSQRKNIRYFHHNMTENIDTRQEDRTSVLKNEFTSLKQRIILK